MKKNIELVLQEIEFKINNNLKLTKEEKKILKENDKEAQEKKKNMSFRERMLHASKLDSAQLMGDDDVDKYPIREYISTGNYLLNAQISGDPFKGMPSGRIWQQAGVNSSGKTFLMLETIKRAQRDHGYFAVIYDTEMANNDKSELKKRGIDTENLLYIPVPTVEQLNTSLLNIIDEASPDDKIIVGIDSIGNISTEKEVNDLSEGNGTKDMTRAALLKALFRTITISAGMKNIPIIVINHVYDQIGGFGGKVIGGGSGSLYNASIINEYTKAQEKTSDGKTTVGACITSTTTKCRTAKEKTKVKFSIDFEDGLTLYSGLLEFCIDEKILVKEKQSYKMNKALLGGYSFFKEDLIGPAKFTPDFWEEFLKLYLADHMRRKFKYQSASEEILEQEEELPMDPELLEETNVE